MDRGNFSLTTGFTSADGRVKSTHAAMCAALAAARPDCRQKEQNVATLLWIIAAILVIAGIVSILRGRVLMGVIAIIVGLLVGPGGVSIFT